jgi:hypothetical protein
MYGSDYSLDSYKKRLQDSYNRLSPGARPIFVSKIRSDPALRDFADQLSTSQIESAVKPTIKPTPKAEPEGNWALDTFMKPFNWIGEHVTEPFGAIVSSPFTQGSQLAGEDWLTSEKRQYKEQVPEWGQFAIETIPWLLPSLLSGGAGLAARGVSAAGMLGKGLSTTAKVGQALSGIGKVGGGGAAGVLGQMGRGGKVAGTLLEYSPWGIAEKAAGAAIGAVLKPVGKGIKNLISPIVEDKLTGAVLPTDELLNQAYKPDNARAFARWSENKPLIGSIIKAIGGESLFVSAESKLPQDIVRRAIVNRARIQNIGTNVQSSEMPRLTKFGEPLKTLEITPEAVMNTAKPKSGQSNYLNDVLEHPNDYTFSTPQSELYVKEFTAVRQELKTLLEKEGLTQSDKVHRIVKGIVTEDGKYVESKFGSDPSMTRIYATQEEAALAHLQKGQKIVYGNNPNEIMEYEIDRTINRIARKRFSDSVGGLGKTASEKFAEYYPEVATELERLINKQVSAKNALNVFQKVASYKATSIPGATAEKIRRGLPELSGAIDQLYTLAPVNVTKIVTNLSRDLRTALKTQPTELKAAVKTISDVNATWRDVKKIAMSDIEDAINSLNVDATIKAKMITGAYKETYIANRKLFKEFLDTNRDFISGIIDQTKQLAKPLRKQRYDFLQGYAGRERLPHKAGEVTERPFNVIPEFRGKFFPDEIATYLEKHYSDAGTQWVRTMGNVGAMSRNLTAVLDDSAPFIQGLFTFGRNPLVWAKSTLKQLEFLAKPENLTKYMSTPESIALHNEMMKYGSTVGRFEIFEAMPQLERLAGKIPVVGKGVESGVRQTFGRAEAAFTGFGQLARDNMWKVMRKPGMSEAELQELARSLDLMTGNLSTKAMGVGATQRDIESAWLFFSPRFTRASLAFIGDVFKGGVSGDNARKSIAGLMAGGSAMYLGVSKALGQEPDFDPRSGKFMTIKVGNDRVGVGGMLYSLARLSGNIASVDSPLDLLKPDRFDNPFIKFMYGKAAPLTGMVVGAIEQKDYLGRPFESPADWARFLADKVVPFSIQPLYAKEEVVPASLAAQFVGARTFPQSPYELRDEEREKQSVKTYGKTYTDLTKLEQNKVNQISEVTKLTERVRSEGRETPNSLAWDNFNNEGENIEGTYRKAVTLASKQYDVTGDGATFRDKIDEANSNRRALYAQRAINPQYKAMQDYFNTPKSTGEVEKMNPLDVAREEYYRAMYSADMYDEFGDYNFAEADRREKLFEQRYGKNAVNYVRDYSTSKWNEPAALKELRAARNTLDPYWDLANQVWNDNPDIKLLWENTPELQEAFDRWQMLLYQDARTARQFLLSQPHAATLVQYGKRLALLKKRYKYQNPEAALALNKFY